MAKNNTAGQTPQAAAEKQTGTTAGTAASDMTQDATAAAAAEKKAQEEAAAAAEKKAQEEAAAATENVKIVRMTLRHRSFTPNYFRCGLRLTKTFTGYDVPADCVDVVRSDKWIEVQKTAEK